MIVRLVFILFSLLIVTYVVLLSGKFERNSEKPIFLQVDRITQNHTTHIELNINSVFTPDSILIKEFIQDYKNIWAHLNNLYETNDIVVGKEYYTEKWFDQLAKHFKGDIETSIQRNDLFHKLHIVNWSSDALVCTVVDSNVVLTHLYPDQTQDTSIVNLAMILLHQGDHWRIDAMKFLD